MSDPREAILTGIRDALDAAGGPRSQERPAAPIPARAMVSGEERVALFMARAQEVQATVDRLDSLHEVPGSVARFFEETGLAQTIAVHGHDLRALNWTAVGLDAGADDSGDRPALLTALAGVAETGALCLTADEEAPLEAAFLPETVLVVLRERDLVGPMEDLWESVGERCGHMPPSLVLVAGPSRSADIQQTVELGAHGPRRLHVLLVRDGAGVESNLQ